MGLSVDRAFRLSEEIWRADRDAESASKHFGETHDQLLERYSAIRARFPAYKKLPQWAQSKLSAGRRLALDMIHRHDLTWVLLIRPCGTWVCKFEELTEEERIRFYSPAAGGVNWEGAHYWTVARRPFGKPPGPAERK